MQPYNMNICWHISLCILSIDMVRYMCYHITIASGTGPQAEEQGGASMRLTRIECLALGFGWGLTLPVLMMHIIGLI